MARRGQPSNPTLFKGADRALTPSKRWRWTVGTGCSRRARGSLMITDDAIKVSDFVVIPMRASGLDLVASQDAVRLCQDAGVA